VLTSESSGDRIPLENPVKLDFQGGDYMLKLTLEAVRVNAGYTQKEAAEILGISNTTLCAWENGKSFPRADQIAKICELYGVTYDQIIFLPNNPV
jgi:transcriptional regulator with XRE-family HTH domain